MRSLPDFKLVVAGRAVKRPYKELLIKEAKGLSNVKLNIGWIPEKVKQKYYEKTDIVVLPYVWAPYQSAVLHDAFSYGLPVVVTKAGAVWEIVKVFRCGEVVEAGSPKAIADGVKKVFLDYNYYKKGIAQYREEANWRQVAKKHSNLYSRLYKRTSSSFIIS